jgi:hypothetical protein
VDACSQEKLLPFFEGLTKLQKARNYKPGNKWNADETGATLNTSMVGKVVTGSITSSQPENENAVKGDEGRMELEKQETIEEEQGERDQEARREHEQAEFEKWVRKRLGGGAMVVSAPRKRQCSTGKGAAHSSDNDSPTGVVSGTGASCTPSPLYGPPSPNSSSEAATIRAAPSRAMRTRRPSV